MAETAGASGGSPSANPSLPTGWNQKNPAVRRILADIRELARDPSDQYAAKPVEENMFEWHFVIRGPKGTDFEGGRYHGKILLPAEYPFKPPHIVFLTPNGRWETRTKICLSMSAYHPEDWQPAWGIRTMLEALISFMPSPPDGALGALDCTPEQRKRHAAESQSYTHPLMPQLPEEGSCSGTRSKEVVEAISQMMFQASKEEKTEPGTPEKPSSPLQAAHSPEVEPVTPQARPDIAPQTEANAVIGGGAETQAHQVQGEHAAQTTSTENLPDRVDDFLKITSWGVLLLIFLLTYRKLLVTFAPEL